MPLYLHSRGFAEALVALNSRSKSFDMTGWKTLGEEKSRYL